MKARNVALAAGVAALVGVAATSVVAARKRREWNDYDTDEIRERLHRRFAEASVQAPDVPQD